MPDNDQLTGEVEAKMYTISKTESVPPPTVPEVYANHVQVGISSIDFNLHFGSMISINAPGTVQVARRVSIVLTPEVAKMLNLQLTYGIANYEKQVRKIPEQMQIHPKAAIAPEQDQPKPHD